MGVVEQVNAIRISQRISLRQIASETGYSPSVIALFLNYRWPGDNARVAADLQEWVAKAKQKEEG